MGGKKRAAPAPTSSKSSTSGTNSSMWSSSKSKKNKKNGGGAGSAGGVYSEAAAAKLFAELADPDDPNTINMEGIFKLGEVLDMDATEDIRILVLLWKMGCKAANKPGEISKEEWLAGCKALNFDSWGKLEALKPSLDIGFLDVAEYKDFYKFCFHFNRQGTHRTLDKELVVALLELVLKDTGRVKPDRLETFCDFLKQNPVTRVTADQWVSFLDFCQEVPDLTLYDESSSAWPVLIDEYVEYMEALKMDGSK